MFEFVINESEREMLLDAYNAITITKSWDFMKQDIDSYMFSNHPKIRTISNAIKYEGHSGASFGITMRTMQYIAINGIAAYENMYLRNV